MKLTTSQRREVMTMYEPPTKEQLEALIRVVREIRRVTDMIERYRREGR